MKFLFFITSFLLLGIRANGQIYLLEQDVNQDTIIPNVGFQRPIDVSAYIAFGFMAGPSDKDALSGIKYFNSYNFREGLWVRKKMNSFYSIGMYYEYDRQSFRLKEAIAGDSFERANTILSRHINNNITFGLFNRFNIVSNRLFADIGAYYAYDLFPRIQSVVRPENADYSRKKINYTNPKLLNRHNYGIDFKITYHILSIYARYRLSQLHKEQQGDLPHFILGLSIDIEE
ncbi:MAG: hypothetical protein H6605_09670 [Flavobacteriales bacterium]|nr:hypothetical protein [Flavobacteriales bacterium]